MGRDEPEDHSKQLMVVNSISRAINFHHLEARLSVLNCQGKLKQPLVGDLGATVYIYKANEDENDIKQSFRATLLPPPRNEAEVPAGFGISLEALLRCRVPNNHDPKNVTSFSFKGLVRNCPGLPQQCQPFQNY